MFYERKVTSFADLMEGLRTLDEDSGVRLVRGSGRKRTLVFTTRSGQKYTMMEYTVKKEGTPGKRLRALEFGSAASLEAVLKGLIAGRIHAWIY